MERKPEKQEIPLSIVTALPSRLRALRMCIDASGLEDKRIYDKLGIDNGHWTRMKQGTASLPWEKYHPLMDLCGNEIPLLWDLHRRGYDITKLELLQDDKDRRIAELEEQLARERQERATIVRFVQETRR